MRQTKAMPENDTPSSELEAAETAAPQTVTAADFAPLDQTQKGQPWWVWAGMGALVLAALFVVFVLPGIVEDYELPLERRVDTLSASTPGNKPRCHNRHRRFAFPRSPAIA
jgi:hypothetical protein